MRLLDTDILIDIQRGHRPSLSWFATLTELLAVPGFVIMELIQDAQNASQLDRLRKLVAPLPIVWPTQVDCSRALADFASFHLSHGIGMIDSLIASVARGLSATLCTFNLKHYRVVPNLVIEQPYNR